MSAKKKAIIAAVLVLLLSAFSWYVAFTDNDPATKPQTEEVVQDIENLVDAIRAEDTAGDAATTAPTE